MCVFLCRCYGFLYSPALFLHSFLKPFAFNCACYLRGFGDSSVDFILHFWVDDVENGRWTPQSEILFAIWHRFAEEGISIPYPQRDLHIKSPGGLDKVIAQQANKDAKDRSSDTDEPRN